MVTAIIIVFVLGYAAIAFEHRLHINKAAIALVTGVLCWTFYIIFSSEKDIINARLTNNLGDLSQILFFLMGAMTIVELIDAHDGFEIITQRIRTTSIRKLLWIICLISFFLSAVLNNLTTTIVMMSLVRKLVKARKIRLIFAGFIIIAVNAGGAWSPIGDVTTTMLWIGGQITAANILVKLFLPSLVCLLVPILLSQFIFRGKVARPEEIFWDESLSPTSSWQRKIVFATGLTVLLLVPVFKSVTHLPPFMGILIGLGIMWVITELIHGGKDEEDRKSYTVAYALRKIDTPSILFFLGILLAIAALESTHLLAQSAQWMDRHIKNQNLIILSIGLLSSVVDNVPLVAATMGMYDIKHFPTDHYLWEFLSYCTGTGGSCLIIGSAAGIAAMGQEKIDFFWYIKRITWLALLGYFAGAIVFILQYQLLNL